MLKHTFFCTEGNWKIFKISFFLNYKVLPRLFQLLPFNKTPLLLYGGISCDRVAVTVARVTFLFLGIKESHG